MSARDRVLDLLLGTQRVADQVDDRLKIELGGHGLLDAVDHRQLGIALLGFLQQPLRFVEEAGAVHRQRGAPGHMGKDKVKLLLNLVACSVTALPRGGEIEVNMAGSFEVPSFLLRCKGTGARPPQYLTEFISGAPLPLDAMLILPGLALA